MRPSGRIVVRAFSAEAYRSAAVSSLGHGAPGHGQSAARTALGKASLLALRTPGGIDYARAQQSTGTRRGAGASRSQIKAGG